MYNILLLDIYYLLIWSRAMLLSYPRLFDRQRMNFAAELTKALIVFARALLSYRNKSFYVIWVLLMTYELWCIILSLKKLTKKKKL